MFIRYAFTTLKSKTYPLSLPYLEQCSFNSNNDTAILMLNLGGPNTQQEIQPFLSRFFADDTVIRIPFGLGPYIAKIRGPAKINNQYKEIGGYSPILKWTQLQGEKMQKDIGQGYLPAFRYGLPLQEDSIEYAFEKTQGKLSRIILFSQYPQYSCSTSGNAIRKCLSLLQQYKTIYPNITVDIIDEWHKNQYYIKAIGTIIKDLINKNNLNPKETLILFTAHSLPADFVWEGDKYPYYIFQSCQLTIDYLKEQGIQIDFDLSYQSKVGLNKWLRPSTAYYLPTIMKRTKQQNIILCPMGFTSDHLETLYELDKQIIPLAQKEAIKESKQIFRADSLNDHPIFIQALSDILKQTQKGRRQRCIDCKFEECQIMNEHAL